jgi:outer membrane biosynthesis protein TonB
MNDDRLISMLSSLRGERMDRIADDKIRRRLENAWTERRQRASWSWRLRRPALALATAALGVGLVLTTLNAGGDSPLYAARITLENFAIPLHTDPEDRAEYLVWLFEERQAEAARLEATGNALAAGRVRAVEQETLRMVRAQLPEAPDSQEIAPLPSPEPTPTPSPTPTPEPSPTPVPTATPRPVTPTPRTPSPTVARPSPTLTPRPVVSPSPVAVLITGTVKMPDGTTTNEACIEFSTAGPCQSVAYVAPGSFKFYATAKIGQTITLYFIRRDATGTIIGKAAVNRLVTGSTLDLGIVQLIK